MEGTETQVATKERITTRITATQREIINNYTLNIDKALSKKLDAANRAANIEYTYTHGGIVIKADVATFELLKQATTEYYGNLPKTQGTATIQKVLDKSKTATVQTTIRVHNLQGKTYTVNLYLTTCVLLVNGKNTQLFVNRDIKDIHELIRNTYCGSNKINITKLNEMMKSKLEQALKSKPRDQCASEENISIKCIKCTRVCRSKSSYCSTGIHWAHYRCQKLTTEEIHAVEDDKSEIHTCKLCDPAQNMLCESRNEPDEERSGALILMDEIETTRNDEVLDQSIKICTICDQEFIDANDIDACGACSCIAHTKCMGQKDEQTICYKCMEAQTYHSDDNMNDNSEHITALKQVHNQNKHEMSGKEKKKAEFEIISPPKKDQNEEINKTDNNFAATKLKEIREREIKIRKAEEQLKSKEKNIKHEQARSIQLETRCQYLEARNMELEALVTTMKRRMQEITGQTQSDVQIQHNPRQNNQSQSNLSTRIELLQDRITDIVMNQVEKQLTNVSNMLTMESPKDEKHNREDNRNQIHKSPVHQRNNTTQCNIVIEGPSPIETCQTTSALQYYGNNIAPRTNGDWAEQPQRYVQKQLPTYPTKQAVPVPMQGVHLYQEIPSRTTERLYNMTEQGRIDNGQRVVNYTNMQEGARIDNSTPQLTQTRVVYQHYQAQDKHELSNMMDRRIPGPAHVQQRRRTNHPPREAEAVTHHNTNNKNGRKHVTVRERMYYKNMDSNNKDISKSEDENHKRPGISTENQNFLYPLSLHQARR